MKTYRIVYTEGETKEKENARGGEFFFVIKVAEIDCDPC